MARRLPQALAFLLTSAAAGDALAVTDSGATTVGALDAGDANAVMDPTGANDAGAAQAAYEGDRNVVPLYGLPPQRTCGCDAVGRDVPSAGALVGAVALAAALVTRRRKGERTPR